MNNLKNQLKLLIKYGPLVFLGAWLSQSAFAQVDVADVIIGSGENKTSELSILTTIINTAQNIVLYGFGPLLGTVMVLKGFKIVGQSERGEKGAGVLMICCGAACFGLGPVIEQLLKLYK